MEPDPAGQPTARMPLQRNLPRSPFPFAPSPRHGMAHGNRAGPLLAPGSTRPSCSSGPSPSCSSGPSPQPAIAPLARQPPAQAHLAPRPGEIKSPACPFQPPIQGKSKSQAKSCQAMSSQVKTCQDMSKAQHETESCFALGLLILDESFTWHRPIFSGGYPPNIVGATAFHSRVRDGSEWFHCAMDTRIERLGFRYRMELTTQ